MGDRYSPGDRFYLWLGAKTGLSYDWLYRRQLLRLVMILLDRVSGSPTSRPR